MSFGTTVQVINAQRVHLYRSTTQLTLVHDVKYTSSRTVDRTNTRAGPIDLYRWKLEEVEATVALTELLLTQLQTDADLDGASALPSETWRINGISVSGTVGDNTDDSWTASLIDYEELAPENGITNVRLRLRILGSAI